LVAQIEEKRQITVLTLDLSPWKFSKEQLKFIQVTKTGAIEKHWLTFETLPLDEFVKLINYLHKNENHKNEHFRNAIIKQKEWCKAALKNRVAFLGYRPDNDISYISPSININEDYTLDQTEYEEVLANMLNADFSEMELVDMENPYLDFERSLNFIDIDPDQIGRDVKTFEITRLERTTIKYDLTPIHPYFDDVINVIRNNGTLNTVGNLILGSYKVGVSDDGYDKFVSWILDNESRPSRKSSVQKPRVKLGAIEIKKESKEEEENEIKEDNEGEWYQKDEVYEHDDTYDD
jgi:hypothetical protein